jgi:MYXO-CTERM domain-containing protein
MMSRRPVISRGAIVLALLGAGSVASAYTPSASKWNPSSLPIGYRINAASAPASLGAAGAIAAVEAGFATWAAPACTTWRSRNDGATAMTRARSGDSERSVLWISSTWPAELGSVNSTIGVTTPVWRSGGYFIDADIQFNAVGFRWGTGTGGTVDTESIAVHEEGHFLGLDHTNVRGSIMLPSYSGGQIRSLSGDDQGGVCFLYPSGAAVPDSGVPADSGVNPGGGDVGAVCNASSPCAAGNRCVCRSATDCFCSRSCSTSSPCPSGFQCANTSIGALCIPGGGGTMMGSGRTGDPCTAPDQCSSGLCVQGGGGAAFCSQACSDDCSCPNNFSCFMTSMAGLSVCGPGTNTCNPTSDDAGGGVLEPDASVPVMDSGVAADAGESDGGRVPPAEMGGCKCSTPGSTRSASGAWALAIVALGAVVARRRRVAR